MSTIPLGLQLDANSLLERGMNATSITLTTAVNVMVISMISFRILRILHKVRKSTNKMRRTYINVIAILVESAAPGAILGIISISLLLTGSFLWNFSVIVWSAYMVDNRLNELAEKLINTILGNISSANHLPYRAGYCVEQG
jgi:hypothetical protein